MGMQGSDAGMCQTMLAPGNNGVLSEAVLLQTSIVLILHPVGQMGWPVSQAGPDWTSCGVICRCGCPC